MRTALTALPDDQLLFVFDDRRFAVFPTGAAAVAEPPALHDLPSDRRWPLIIIDGTRDTDNHSRDESDRSLDAIGGRWPDAMFVTTSQGHARSYYVPEVWRWAADRWAQEPTNLVHDSEFELQWGYVGLLPWVDGGLLGVRDLVCGTVFFVCSADEMEPGDEPEYAALARKARRAFRSFKPLVVAHGKGTALPKLPGGSDSRRMHATASGDIFVPRAGAVEHWSVAHGKWRARPLPGGSATPTLVGHDPADLYALTCEREVGGLARLVGDAFVPEPLPASACLGDFAVERGGALWALHGNYVDPTDERAGARGEDADPPATELWRRPLGGAWERVSIAPVQLAVDAAGRWRSDGLRWRHEPPHPGPVQVVAQAIEALGPGDVFVQVRARETGDALLLRDRPLPAALIDLAPTQIARYEHETNDLCVPQHLVLSPAEQASPELLAALAGTPGLELYEVPGTGVVAMLDGPSHAPARKKAALNELRARLRKVAPDASEPRCGLPATPRRAHTIAAAEPASP